MFRRKRSSSNVSVASSTTTAATTAAVQAFVKRKASDASLSSAAAAAALRSHTTSPTPVGDIQTKRMMRKGSVSSIGSNVTDSRPALHRRGSSGSMTERSFRSPSPGGRPAGKIPPIPTKSHRRSASQEAPPLRVASPDPADGARGVSMDRGTKPAARRIAGRPASLAQVLEQPDQPQTKVVYNPETRKLETRVFYPPKAPSAPLRDAPNGRSSKASSGPWHMGATTGASVTAAEPTQPGNKKVMRPIENPNLVQGGPAGKFADAPLSPGLRPTSPAMSDVSLSTGLPKRRTPFSKEARGLQVRPAAVASQLAVTAAQAQKDKAEAATAAQRKAAAMLARPLSAYAPVAEHASIGPDISKPIKVEKPAAPQGPSSAAAPTPSTPKPAPLQQTTPQKTSTIRVVSSGQDSSHLTTPTQASQVSRAASTSPARSAHFSDRPVVPGVKHNPPPRSISPVKSALKSHSPQRSSPTSSYLTAQDAEDTASTVSEDTPTSKRKSVRVSFEETPVAIGVAAPSLSTDSPTIASPQNSRFTAKALLGRQTEDETMGARPLLPSFGSVRTGNSRSPLGIDEVQSIDSDPTPPGTSNDNAAGSILAAAAAASKDEPVVTAASAPVIAVVPATPHLDEEDKQLEPSEAGAQEAAERSANADAPNEIAQVPASAAIAAAATDEGIPDTENEDWDRVRAYWSSLSEKKKLEIEQEAKVHETAAADLPPWPDRQYQESVKKTAAAQPEPKTMRKSMRGAEPVQPPATTTVPAERTTLTKKPATTLQKTVRQPAPQLSRTLSNDSSASESSFKRSRARSKQSKANGGRYTMRGSMRGADPQPDAPVNGSARMSLRQDPPRSLRTGRSSSIDEGTQSKGFFGLGKSKAKAGKAGGKAAPRFSSRFADSSDEEEPSSNWRSRFVESEDSSDDEARPMKLTPVRGIPKRAGRDEGDSTDLDDTDDEVRELGGSPVARKGATNGTATAATHELPSTMRAPGTPDGKKSKRGLFGLGKKKRQDGEVSAAASPSTGALSAAAVAVEGGDSNPASPSRPSKGLRARPNSILRRFSSPTSPSVPPQTINGQNFEYPVPPIPVEHQQAGTYRPNTSDGVPESRSEGRLAARGSMRDKRASALAATGSSETRISDGIKPVIVSARTGKPKKFQGLRRVFGMTD